MKSDNFEKAFNDFLERKEYDEAEAALFLITRAAFTAGWLAAGGKALKPQTLFELMLDNNKRTPETDDNCDKHE
ncbi:MAG: hypothetical protein KBI01_00040 [Oscillospiraceae bacterium]|nr:hypothetical protein [Oscillospiraceae bacterium]